MQERKKCTYAGMAAFYDCFGRTAVFPVILFDRK
jgi:hypothetical protein